VTSSTRSGVRERLGREEVGSVDRLNLDLLIDRSGDGYRARVVRSPGGEGDVTFALPRARVDLERLLEGSAGPPDVREPARDVVAGRAGRLRPTAMADFGRWLFGSVFVGPVALCYARSLNVAHEQGLGLRIRLRLADVPELLDLPWELLYDPARNGFVASSNRTPLLRYLDLPNPLEPLAVDGALRMLVVVSSPTDLPRLDAGAEWDRLNDALAHLAAEGRVVLEPLEIATLDSMRKTLEQGGHHVLHFIGHGGFDSEAGQGLLVLEADDGSSVRVRAEDLSDALAESDALRLAVLNTCEGARSSVVDPFAGTAQALVARGVPAVVAMQFEVTDQAAVGFAQGFYTAVATGSPVDDAVTEGRLAMMTRGDGSEWATPVLYTHADDTRIFALPPAAPPPPVGVAPADGRVAAGEFLVRIDDRTGVWIDPNPEPVTPRPRPSPVAVLPPPFPVLLGRDPEVAMANAGAPGETIRFVAEAGWGKSALLRAWANRIVGTDPGGTLFLRSLTRPARDVLQFLFESLYQTDLPFEPDEGQLAEWLAGIQAAVVLDDVQLTPEDLVLVQRIAPRCRFVLGGRSSLGAPGREIRLVGIPPEAGIDLVELELGRTLEGSEREDARRLCEAVGGSPARILAEAERAWRDDRPLGEVVAELGPTGAEADGRALPLDARSVLGVLAAVDPAPIHASHLIEVAHLEDPLPVFESLERARLVAAGSPMFTLTFSPAGREDLEADSWTGHVFEHLAGWARQASPDEVVRDADLLLTAIRLGRNAGRYEEVAALGRAIEGPLIAGRRWGQWELALQAELAAAAAAGNLAAQGWAYHQAGSRALALGDRAGAREPLSRALDIRERLGDRAGVEATRHNLGLAGGAGGPPNGSGGPDGGGFRWGLALGGLAVVAVIGFLAWFFFFRNGGEEVPGTPKRSVAPASVDFGQVTTGSTSTFGVTVTNTGGGSMTVTDVAVDPDVDGVELGDGCDGATLDGNESCTVDVTFAPDAEGPVQTDLVISDDTGAGPERVPITGAGVSTPVPGVTIDPPALDFGEQVIGTRTASTVTVKSSGQADLLITGGSQEGDDKSFQVVSENCRGATLPRDDSCQIEVAFTPLFRGTAEGSLVLLDDAGEGRQTIPLTGAGVTDLPNLVVTSFERTGDPIEGKGTVEVPVRVVVRNDADVPAGVFKVAVEFTSPDSDGSTTVDFQADPSDDVDVGDPTFPFTSHDLAADEEVVITGRLIFVDDGVSRDVEAVATADSCLGEDSADLAVCRVEEVSEDDNASSPLPIHVPTFVVE